MALLLAALCLATTIPSSEAAFHNARWTATGVAAGADEAYLISVTWKGACTPGWAVDLKDPVTQAVVSHRDFAGYQVLYSPPAQLVEFIVDYGVSTDPGVTFSAVALQAASIGGGHFFMGEAATGTYQSLAWTGVVAQFNWQFC